MTHNNHPFTILRHTIVYRVKTFEFYHITKFRQRISYKVKIPPVGISQIANVLEQENFRLYPLYGINKNRETITSIFHPFLIAEHTERLTGRSTYYNICLGIFETHCQLLMIAPTRQILIICVNGVLFKLISNRLVSSSFKAQ